MIEEFKLPAITDHSPRRKSIDIASDIFKEERMITRQRDLIDSMKGLNVSTPKPKVQARTSSQVACLSAKLNASSFIEIEDTIGKPKIKGSWIEKRKNGKFSQSSKFCPQLLICDNAEDKIEALAKCRVAESGMEEFADYTNAFDKLYETKETLGQVIRLTTNFSRAAPA